MKITGIRRFGRLLFLQLLVIFTLNCSRAELISADESRFSEIGTVDEKVDVQVKELEQLFDDYADLMYDTENVIQGLNKLGLHYNSLAMSLRKTKSLIEEISKEHSKLREENERLKQLIQLDKGQLDKFLKYQEEKTTWSNRWEALAINLIAFIVGVIGDRIYTKLRLKKHNKPMQPTR